jgi:hypothetical protein
MVAYFNYCPLVCASGLYLTQNGDFYLNERQLPVGRKRKENHGNEKDGLVNYIFWL